MQVRSFPAIWSPRLRVCNYGTQEGAKGWGERQPWTCSAWRRDSLWSGPHLCIFQRHIRTCDRFVGQGNTMPSNRRNEGEGRQRWEQPIRCYACCTGRCHTLQGDDRSKSKSRWSVICKSVPDLWLPIQPVIMSIKKMVSRKGAMRK